MERAGIYRKGRQGHARNVSSYRISMQRFKKWRLPLTALAALVLVFGMAPTVGQEFQASLLTNTQYAALSKMPSDEAKKKLFESLHFKIDECVTKGKQLESVFGTTALQPKEWLSRIEEFVAAFEKKVALEICRYDLANTAVQLAETVDIVQWYSADYEDVLDTGKLSKVKEQLVQAKETLGEFVQQCQTR